MKRLWRWSVGVIAWMGDWVYQEELRLLQAENASLRLRIDQDEIRHSLEIAREKSQVEVIRLERDMLLEVQERSRRWIEADTAVHVSHTLQAGQPPRG